MKSKKRHQQSGRRGFLLMESLLAFAIFGIAVTGILLALQQTSNLSREVIRSQWAKQEARNLMLEVLTIPTEESEFVRDEVREIDDTTRARILVEPHEDVDKDGNELQGLYRVTITLMWEENERMKEVSYSTVHYARMFSQGR